MGEHQANINMHPVAEQIFQAEKLLKSLKNYEDISTNDLEVILRIEYVIENFQHALVNTDRLLVSVAWLDAVNVAISQVIRFLKQWQNRNQVNRQQHLANAARQLDVILENTAKMNTVKSKNNF